MATIAAVILMARWPKDLWQFLEFSARFPGYNASVDWKASTPAGFSKKLVIDSIVAAIGEVLHQRDFREFEIGTKVDGLKVAQGRYTAELLSATANKSSVAVS